MRTARGAGVVLFFVVVAAAIAVPVVRAQRRAPTAAAATSVRTAAELKINERVRSEIQRRRGEVRRKARTGVQIDRHGRALVDVRAAVRPALERKVQALGGVIVAASPEYDSIVGWMPLLTLDRLAADPSVRAIDPALR